MNGFPARPTLQPLAPGELRAIGTDRQLYELTGDFVYVSDIVGQIVVPAGFKTDFASIPRPAFWYIDPEDPQILFPSIIHDYLYTVHGDVPGRQELLTKHDADAVLREAMIVCGARPAQAQVVFLAVHWFGGSHWK